MCIISYVENRNPSDEETGPDRGHWIEKMGLLGNSNSLVSDIGESNAVYVYNRFGIVFHQSSFKCYHFFFSGSDSIGLMSNCYNGRLTGGETLPIKRPEKTTDWNDFMFLFPLG